MILSLCKAGPKANLQLLTPTIGGWHGPDLSQLSSVPSELEDILRKNVDVKDTAVLGIMSDER